MAEPWLLLFTSLVFLGVLLTSTFLRSSLEERRRAARQELSRRVGNLMDEARLVRLQRPESSGLGDLGEALRMALRRAGDDRSAGQLLLACALYAGVGLFCTLWLLQGPATVSGLLFGGVPCLVLRARARQRSDALSAQLPDALDLIARAMRAGHAFSDALRLSVMEVPAPIAEELGQVSEQHRLGVELREGLEQLVQRNPDNFDLRLLGSAVLLQRETGGNLIETLDRLSETIRERIVFRGKVEALTAEVRFSAVILTVLPFFVAGLILLVQPEYLLPLVVTRLGRVLLAIGVLFLSVGVLVMRQLSQVEAA